MVDIRKRIHESVTKSASVTTVRSVTHIHSPYVWIVLSLGRNFSFFVGPGPYRQSFLNLSKTSRFWIFFFGCRGGLAMSSLDDATE